MTIPLQQRHGVFESGSMGLEYVDIDNSSSERGSAQETTNSSSITVSRSSKTTHSLPVTASMLHVLDLTQLEVHLPFHTSLSSDLPTKNTMHRMSTRLQTGTIQRKDYLSYIATLP